MLKLTVNHRSIAVPEGSTLLDACRAVGAKVPTLCFVNGQEHITSCMVCVVRNAATGRLLPACSAPAEDGMSIETDSDEVRTARRSAIELLLTEHRGDCEAPCTRACPAHMNIPLMIRHIRDDRFDDAIRTVVRDIPIPAILGRICPAPCEKACRRGRADQPVAICLLKRFAADTWLLETSPSRWPDPPSGPRKGPRVAVVGAGPTGLSAAAYLALRGICCTVFDGREKPGGALRYAFPPDKLPQTVIDAEVDMIRSLGVEFAMNTPVIDVNEWTDLTREFKAVVVATGSPSAGDATQQSLSASFRDMAPALGIQIVPTGIKADPHTRRIGETNIFAGGAAIRACRMAVAAVADGKAMAASVAQALAGTPVVGDIRPFDSRMGSVGERELAECMKDASSDRRTAPAAGSGAGFLLAEAHRESARCMHCDCRKTESCKLRECADACQARQHRFTVKPGKAGNLPPQPAPSPSAEMDTTYPQPFERVVQHADVVYEPGKCIKCGLCVRITRDAGEKLGLTFIGRGFSVRMDVPLNGSLADALTTSAADCVRACPTGALAFRRD